MSAPVISPPAPAPVASQLDELYAAGSAVREGRKRSRRDRPLVRLWDGNWALRGIVASEYEASFTWLLNETGTGRIVLPADHYLARWVMDTTRSTQNVHVTVDKDGARWSGRMRKATLKKSESGLKTVEIVFAHDFEELKFIYVWSNPFLPFVIQFPRYFTLVGPSRWALKLALFLNIMRLESSLWQLPDDPLDPSQWFDFDQSHWSMVVAPGALDNDVSLWAIINSRWKNYFDLAKPILDDAELMVTCRRYLDGDPPPWPGANLRHGCLVLDIVDRSGWYTGPTAGEGTVWDGLRRTVFEMTADFIDGTMVDAPPGQEPGEYLVEQWMGTKPTHPWVVYREAETTGIQSSEFSIIPPTAVTVDCGGKSTYGVNEAIGTAIQIAGDALAAVPLGVPIGGALNQWLQPIYEDTLLAWMSIKNPWRAQRLGWSHYHEFFQPGADRAFTVSSLIALRAGFWATKGQHNHKLTVADGAPYYIGEHGRGHFFLGDRIGATIAGGPPGHVFVDRVTELELSWERGRAPAWDIGIGQDPEVDPFARALKHLQNIFGVLHDLDVI
ncbi:MULTISPECIES: phage tail protein [unclassified Nocardia]|uniref:Gp37-like protein n=1 Tax=unclassified Nocardia TaxID=2637762 RepID=UPI00278C7015|nr:MULTISPECIES: phage tail protein [unclassified Nocardia]